ncbi:unnamed protein product [Arctia plantaginis]|uniref:Dynein regulatory complex protein 9 n=1 Tax=Arctia plantaginis TaxID=874455 RepID=A0A8S1APD4_ARCPL|nr:unnamed protein product [Arctia plantaginis]
MDQNESRISKMDALLFALSFEVVLLQMRILEGSSKLRIREWRPTTKIERLQYAKLREDRDLVEDVIRETLIQVIESGRWDAIKKTIEVLKEKDSDLVALKHSNEKLKMTGDGIQLELELKRNQWNKDLRDADCRVAVLRDKMSEREECLEYWRQRYDTDTVAMTITVQKKCEELKLATVKRMELQKLYDLHEGEMRGWLNFKRERAARLAREEHQRLSAIRIQAWWRGVLVRKALGQFKYLRQTKKQPGKGKKK